MLNKISISSLKFANYLVGTLSGYSTTVLFLFALLLTIFFIVGKRLSKLSKPEWPLLSPVIRKISYPIFLLGYFVSVVFTIYILLLITCTEFGFFYANSANGLNKTDVLIYGFFALWKATKDIFYPVFFGFGFGMSISLFFVTRVIPNFERGEGLHDINHLVKTFQKLNGYNPMPYIDIQKGCFIGLDTNKKPIYVPWKKIRETHIQVIGTTGCGKGVLLTLIAYQSILVGENLIWIDPKFDRFSPRILAAAAKQVTKSFYLINLNPDQPPQLNPFEGAEAHEIEELLVSAFDLKGKGTDGDFHRGKDEDAAIEASRLAVEKKALSLPKLIEVCRSVESITSQENFWRKLCKLGDLNAIKTAGGINLKDAILNGSVIYIVGSTDNERVKMLQKLLLVRINQIIKKQDRFKKTCADLHCVR
jgi:AAA-like domain